MNLDDAVSEWILDHSDPENPVAVVNGSKASAQLLCNKDLLTITTSKGHVKTYNLEGVIVYAENTERVYVPRQALRIMKRHRIR